MSLDFMLYTELDGEQIGVFSRNITHNLGKMADAAGIYYALWRPTQEADHKTEKTVPTYARELIETLAAGLKDLKENPEFYKKFEPENGWGTYEGFVEFVDDVLFHCRKYPSAMVETDR